MDDDDRIANCLICTVAEALRVCKVCAFNIGLPFRAVKERELSAESLCRVDEIRERFVISVQILDKISN